VVALVLLLAAPVPAQDSRVLSTRVPVLVDGAGQVVGQAFPPSSPADPVPVLVRAAGRAFLLVATPSSLGPAPPAPVGQVVFEQPDCAGPAWFFPLASLPPTVLVPLAVGPGDTTLFTPDGPPQGVFIQSYWVPEAQLPCQPDASNVVASPAVLVLDLATFSPPYAVR
jgi:hypothetical protein